jgi:lipopolysaccharide/colanic/teichoic acid biosynthesis glycosyltransferase
MAATDMNTGLTAGQRLAKRCFDLLVAVTGLLLGGWLILLAWLLASIDTRSNGFFIQERVGRNGRTFHVIKIKTMRDTTGGTTVTQRGDPRITYLGTLLRKLKIDELPQLFNVLVGSMSLVGPRPDVSGFADTLTGEERLILSIAPGITGPATLKYRDEEALLAQQAEPEKYNREVIWPDKVKINLYYVRNWRFTADLRYILQTVSA